MKKIFWAMPYGSFYENWINYIISADDYGCFIRVYDIDDLNIALSEYAAKNSLI